ncbi:LOW QUALITY PROTEIN: zinc finger CCCH-type antiviral protein 1 [Macrotis lagotis]|uniref:LOW QUALITY PROTEIN: zinc finger CCCH-type antiviral protein 1 n=1 Tax=Macrotis lagotis TaxID=92651 RepID=UPI003D686D8E
MADPAVCGFLTALLCSHGGRMGLRELLGHIELAEAQLLEVLLEAGPERFVLLDQGPDGGRPVLATTPVRVCRRVACRGPCEALHLCKLNLLDRCRRDRTYCKYSHEIHSERNIKILKKHDISVLSKNDLAVLLLQSDPFFLPDVCKFYKGENRQDSCPKNTECLKLHICEHFIEGKCGFVHCNRSHNLMDPKVLKLLKEEGLTDSIIKNIQDICNQKHSRSKKLTYKKRGFPNKPNVRSRSQSRNRYYFGIQELSPTPSDSGETACDPESDKTDPSCEDKVNESKAIKNNITLNQDCVQAISATPKTVSTQEMSQVGTNFFFPVTGSREDLFGNQDDIYHAASSSPPASGDKGVTPTVSKHTSRRVNVFFGSEADSYSGPGPITTSKSTSVPSYNYTNAGNDYGKQKTSSSLAPRKTVVGSSAMLFSKCKSIPNLKKEESSSKSEDNQSMLGNPQMAQSATLIGKLETPVANNIVPNASSSVSSKTSSLKNKLKALKIDDTTGAITLDVEKEKPFCGSQKIQPSPLSNPAMAHVRPKTSSVSNVTRSAIRKGILAQSSLPTDFRTVSNTRPSGIKNDDSNDICLDYLLGNCKLQSCCKYIHFHLPYQWQVYISFNWKDLKDMEEIEKAYCDPSISKSHSIDFQKMEFVYYPVRRLSTPSTVLKSSVLTTKWHWYWKNDYDQWIEYGKGEGSGLTSGDLEFFFLLCPEEFVEFSDGGHKYKVNFKEMIQTNLVTQTKREVRRRPEFVSNVTVYWNQKQTDQHREKNKQVSLDLPSHWDQMTPSDAKYQLVKIKSTLFEHFSISCCFKTTMRNFEIQKIMRNQNPSLWNNFQRMKKKMLNGGNEKKLFHAADQHNMDLICRYNCDWSLQLLRKENYGKGIYFSKDASSSHSLYNSNAKNRIMFVANVLVGTYTQGKQNYTQPPLTYNSCVDSTTNPSTFVIFDKNQIYPEYIIEYTVIDTGCNIS